MSLESHKCVVDPGFPDTPEAVMAHHSKTFFWAARLFPQPIRRDLAVLYTFCRFVDDVGDEGDQPVAACRTLADIQADLDRRTSTIPQVHAFLELARRREIPLVYAHQLVAGVISDTSKVRIETHVALLHYCYRVASTVGLMLCSILNVKDPHALAFATDLGIAMQLTNIARDVVEDFDRDRIYLPRAMIRHEAVRAAIIQKDTASQDEVYRVILVLLDFAERYYRSADRGMRYLPWWARWAILSASRMYEAIGTLIKRQQNEYWERRVWTSTARKVVSTLSAGASLVLNPRYWDTGRAPRHEPELHSVFAHLLAADQPIRKATR